MTALNEQAYEHLQNLILSNQLSYQQVYSETKLSKELGISRTPFRDAIHRLAQEGYVDIIPSRGFTLHQLSKKDVMEKLREILNTTQSIPAFSKYDFQFHTKIIEYLKNEQFASVFATFLYRMQRLAALSLSHEGRMQDTFLEHQAILDTMKRGDTEHIYEVTLQHMEKPREINLEDL